MREALLATALVWVAVAGTAAVFTRQPLRQAFVAGFFGLALANLYLTLQAGDVALSQLVVGAIALPLIVLLALAKVGNEARRTTDSGDGRTEAPTGTDGRRG